jgi:threonine/homoserine/homoserine lactone efflux protein
LVDQQLWLRLLGGAFLLYLGLRTFREQPAGQEIITREVSYGGLMETYASTFFLTITNPLTVLSFVAIFAGLGLVGEDTVYTPATVLVLGVFSGSALWWLLLSGGVSLFRSKLSFGALRWVNRGSGTIILGLGIAALLSLLRSP